MALLRRRTKVEEVPHAGPYPPGWDVPARFNFARDVVEALASDPLRPALTFVDHEGIVDRRTFREVAGSAARWAHLLRTRVERGERVVLALGKVPAWHGAMLGALKGGLVAVPCPDMLRARDLAFRVRHSGARLVVADRSLELEIEEMRQQVEASISVIYLDDALEELRRYLPVAPTEDTAAGETAFILYTSGATKEPRGVAHTHAFTWAQRSQATHWLDVREGDVVWCTAGTGWAKAIWNSLLGPWSHGVEVVLHEGPFDAEERLSLVQRLGITVLCQTPTEYRMLAKLESLDVAYVPKLRHAVSTGEPLNPEVIARFQEALGITVHDGYGQTESSLLVANTPAVPVRPGSMGLPTPGHDVAVIDEIGNVCPPGVEGDLALNGRPPTLFTGYWDAPDETDAAFRNDWYLTGDRALRDEDGYVWFVGRSDEVIVSSAYRIGPFEVESALLEHPAVAESAVVGVPDPDRGQIVKAFVILRAGHEATGGLATELQEHVKTVTAPYKYPRSIAFVDELPKTPSGKIDRAELRRLHDQLGVVPSPKLSVVPEPVAEPEAEPAPAAAPASGAAERIEAETARVAAEAAERARADAAAQRQAEERARAEAEDQVRREAEEQARREAAERAGAAAEEQARREAEEQARREAEAAERAGAAAEEQARREAEEQARREAEAAERARAEAEAAERARLEAEAQARREAEERARAEAEAAERARLEAEAQARREAEERARAEAEAAERARLEAEAQARREAEERARAEAEAAERARLEAEAQARREAEERARAEAEAAERARLEAEAQARREAEEQARREAEAAERARLEAEAQARREAEERARAEAEAAERARLEAEAQARRGAEEQARREAEAAERARAEAEAAERARLEAEELARREAAVQAQRQAESTERARLEAGAAATDELDDELGVGEASAEAVRESRGDARRRRREEKAEAKRRAEEERRQAKEAEEQRKREEAAAREEAKRREAEEKEAAKRRAEEERMQAKLAAEQRKREEAEAREAEKAAARQQAEDERRRVAAEREAARLRKEEEQRLRREEAKRRRQAGIGRLFRRTEGDEFDEFDQDDDGTVEPISNIVERLRFYSRDEGQPLADEGTEPLDRTNGSEHSSAPRTLDTE